MGVCKAFAYLLSVFLWKKCAGSFGTDSVVSQVKMCLMYLKCICWRLLSSFRPWTLSHLCCCFMPKRRKLSGCWWLCVNACSLITTIPGWLVREDAISLWPLSHQENVSRTRKPAVTPFPVTISQKSVRQLQFPKMPRGLARMINKMLCKFSKQDYF